MKCFWMNIMICQARVGLFMSWPHVSICWDPFHGARNCRQLSLFSLTHYIQSVTGSSMTWKLIPWQHLRTELLKSWVLSCLHRLHVLDKHTNEVIFKLWLWYLYQLTWLFSKARFVSLLLIQYDSGFLMIYVFLKQPSLPDLSKSYCDGVSVKLKSWNVIMGQV